MANPNPNKARATKAQKRREALEPILDAMRKAVFTARELLTSEDQATQLRAVHAVSQAAVSYARVYEVGELENRLEEVERRLEAEEVQP